MCPLQGEKHAATDPSRPRLDVPDVGARVPVPATDEDRAVTESLLAEASNAAMLSELGEALLGARDYDDITACLRTLLCEGLADAAVVEARLDDQVERLVAHRDPEEEAKLGGVVLLPTADSWLPEDVVVLRAGKERAVPAAEPTPQLWELGFRLAILAPLAAQGAPLGVIALLSTRNQPVHDRQRTVVGEIARRVARCLEQIAERKHAERAIEAEEQFIRLVSHDLRGPLNVLQLGIQSLLRSWPPRGVEVVEAQRQLEILQRAAERMDRLTRDLMDLAQIESGRLLLDRMPYALGMVLTDALTLYQGVAKRRFIQLRCAEHRVRTPVLADYFRLQQVLSNLIGNALKFTPEGGEVVIEAHESETEITIHVCDSGPGIPEADLPHLFERFWQGQRSRRDGAGLGLAIAKRLVEAHGGRISAENRPEGGARFSLVLPAATAGVEAASTLSVRIA